MFSPHAFGVDDIESISPLLSLNHTVLNPGHFNQSQVGYFWVAPKHRDLSQKLLRAADVYLSEALSHLEALVVTRRKLTKGRGRR